MSGPRVRSVPLPGESWLQDQGPFDYTDAFSLPLPEEHILPPDELMVRLFCDPPTWVKYLMGLRNTMVQWVGLESTGGPEALAQTIRKGGNTYADFSIIRPSSQETVLYGRDKHLDFYLSVLITEGTTSMVTASTAVQMHNRLGHVYFFCIRPFHACVVPAALKRAVQKTAHPFGQ